MRCLRSRRSWTAALAVCATLGIAGAGRSPVSAPDASPSPRPRAKSAASDQCVSCHAFPSVLSHPVGVIPKMSVPGSLPLENGQLACTTCHETGAGARDSKCASGFQLRPTIGGGTFCSQCHAASTMGAAGAHASATEQAHFVRSGAGGAGSRGRSGTLDAESGACMSCHDGSAARDIGSHGLGRLPESGSEHPIAVPYGPKRGPVSEVRLVDRSKLDPTIRLFDRSIGCGSCHSVYSTSERLLVKANTGSALCLSCHVE